ncbi:VWA domain-containing protein [Thalassomonas viridans]|uniref:VWA domain-containing protein n=1 Tax=Thalassomonas viridans TaxID=137584 RepID=A0AAE9Z0D1_9GAMM|nr:VWA domain-containing protein [Thalassomonas viridans]WDE03907.1 VWA domain-containing protein [Thalassomonas viridans]
MADFHFIRPWALLAFFALFLVLWLLKRMSVAHSGWQQFLPGHLARVLINGTQTSKPLSLTLPFIIGTLGILALAGPTWQKLPQPVYQVDRGSVLVMDMSYSMYSTDLAPNRLTRARYKASDLLDSLNEGEIGLVAYAGDAFTISPLTEDINNIKLLLPAITPEIMPELGSNPLAALTLAHEMLANAGHLEGDIYWFTDGIDREDIEDINEWSRSFPHRLNILGVGSSEGAPITLPSGELMKDDSGAIVVPRTNEKRLYGLASKGRGTYRTIANDNADINALIALPPGLDSEQEEGESQNLGDQWQEAGPYLLLLLLPLLLGYFRRGTIVALLPLTLVLMPQKQAYAIEWQDLWKTKDQQAQQQFNQQNYSQAAKNFKDPLWQGSAHYKAGDFEKAVESFAKFDSSDALYNKGNALAKMQKFDDAIEAYQQALEKDPELIDAQKNKQLIEELKKQQEQQQQQNQDQQNQQQDNQDQEQQGQDSQQQQQQGQDQESQQQNSEPQQSDQQQGQESEQQQQDQQQSDRQQGQDEQSEQEKQEQQAQAEQEQAEREQAEQEQQAKEQEAEQQNETPEQQQARLAQEKADQETEQKHQQLLNKVTDDPYLLLRNKMQIEYQKRRQHGAPAGVQKKW